MSVNVAPLAGSVDRNANALEPRLCGDRKRLTRPRT